MTWKTNDSIECLETETGLLYTVSRILRACCWWVGWLAVAMVNYIQGDHEDAIFLVLVAILFAIVTKE